MCPAFKEWAVVVDALGRGEQILILRKGGIAEGRGGFRVEHPRFWLFPTMFHQQREAVIESAVRRYDEMLAAFPKNDVLQIEFIAEVVKSLRLETVEAAAALKGQHVWRDDVIAQRFDWGRSKNIFALAVRVYRLPQPVHLATRAEYGGCKSWVELRENIDEQQLTPVLSDLEFAEKLGKFEAAMAVKAGQFRA